MLSTRVFIDLKESAERCFSFIKEYLEGLGEVEKEYLEFKSETNNSLQYRIGFRHFVIIADIHPIFKNPHIIFKTFEILDFLEEKRLIEIKDLDLTHFNDDSFGASLTKHDLQGTYFSKLEKAIYSS